MKKIDVSNLRVWIVYWFNQYQKEMPADVPMDEFKRDIDDALDMWLDSEVAWKEE
tara:strand:+ start:3371 stop:3535 length:165 start_codon:yes stop_codon:yes gene_type:complete